MAVFREDGCIDTVNHAWTVLFGRSKNPGADYYDPEEKACTVDWLSQAIDDFAASKQTERTIHRAVATNLGERLFNMRIKRMLDVSEKFSGTVIMLDDVTQCNIGTTRSPVSSRSKWRSPANAICAAHTVVISAVLVMSTPIFLQKNGSRFSTNWVVAAS